VKTLGGFRETDRSIRRRRGNTVGRPLSLLLVLLSKYKLAYGVTRLMELPNKDSIPRAAVKVTTMMFPIADTAFKPE
jgi:hypothetical protein